MKGNALYLHDLNVDISTLIKYVPSTLLFFSSFIFDSSGVDVISFLHVEMTRSCGILSAYLYPTMESAYNSHHILLMFGHLQELWH